MAAWNARRFFDLVAQLGPLRVISICGPSVFESLCSLGAFEISGAHLNAISRQFHWHVDLRRFRWLRSCDEIHGRSGRRVLFFELCEERGAKPFLLVYLYREPDEPFDAERERRFVEAHAELAKGVALELEGA
jgi:hypothetical protein